jgi:hypothetical protein
MFGGNLGAIVVMALLAVSGGDVALLIGALVGAGGIGGITTGWVSLRKLRIEEAAAADENRVTAKTVAAAEAEAAMRVMGASVSRLEAEVLQQGTRLVSCEERCRACQTEFAAHAAICPILGGSPPDV